MTGPLGWVVVEWNQASHQPDLPGAAGLHWTREDAEFEATVLRESAAERGRRERYTVAEVHEEGGDD